MMLNPFLWLIVTIIDLYSLALFVWVIMSLLIQFNIINRYQPLVRMINDFLTRIIEPALQPIRRMLPNMGALDLSPLVLILALQFIQRSLVYYF